MTKKPDPALTDIEQMRELIDFQTDALNRGIFCMVFKDRDHFAEARENMLLGARIKSTGLVFFNPVQLYIQ